MLAAGVVAALLCGAPARGESDDEIRRLMIQRSIGAYVGNCPCPYNVMRNGRSCGRYSAYSKPGGRSPLCYPEDISQKMVDEYRRGQSSTR